jgi:glycosyltransferase involved in cell wall biosynthesis
MSAPDQRIVLFVAYEFPPTGGAGVQRLAKFARYLPENGWRPVVLAARHVKGRVIDETLAAEVAGVTVVRTPARPINAWVSSSLTVARAVRDRLFRRRPKRGGSSGGGAVRFAERVATTGKAGRTEQITRLVGVPDFARLWVGPAVRAGVRLGKETGAEVVFASGPPFSVMLAGRRIARALGVPLVVDFRDAWRDNPGNAWYPSRWHERRSLALERMVLKDAAAVTTAHPMADEVLELGGPQPTVVPNGFDSADLPPWEPDPAGPLIVTFMGMFYSARDPLPVFQALKDARAGVDGRTRDIRLRIVGRWPEYVEAVIDELGLEEAVELVSYRPHHEALRIVSHSDVGLVVLADLPCVHGTPAKLYEYLGIGIPVLFVGPAEGHAQSLIAEANAGVVVPYSDTRAIARAFTEFADAKAAGRLGADIRRDVVGRYERRAQATDLAKVLDAVTMR